MVTCKSSKSRTSLDFGGMGEFGLGQKGHQLGIYMPLKTIVQAIHPLTKNCLIFWLFVLRPSTPLARPWLHHFKLLFRTFMQLYEILCEDIGKLVVQTFISHIIFAVFEFM